MGRKFFVGGNWKMNGTKKEIDDIVAFLKAGPLDPNVGMCLLKYKMYRINIQYKSCNYTTFAYSYIIQT